MRLYEFQAKQLFSSHGIPVPEGGVANSPEEAGAVAERIGGPVAVKAQILAGKRGKAGGIRFADDAPRARSAAAALLGTTLNDFVVESVLVER